ncbi:MAG: TIGR01212 family radical SAM protein [Clostridiales bacterium]|nr:TIGR01212 family radical SAM protein [Clostridiales bacterium]
MTEDFSVRDWLGKPYYSLNAYFKQTYGQKCYKIAVDAGLTCPNRDGTLDTRGCIFCSGGSGNFAVDAGIGSVKEQIREGLSRFNKKAGERFVIYFQAYTNTYGPVDYLREIFSAALSEPLVIGISIATRPDALGAEILELLHDLQRSYEPEGKFLWVELGLQTIHEKTAAYIRRGYELPVYERAVRALAALNIPCITHVILGLPGESTEDMLATVTYLNGTESCPRPFGVKLQLLHVLKGTDLDREYLDGKFQLFTEDEYVDVVIQCIRHLDPRIVLHRVTGDGPKALLTAPLWSGNKKQVLNHLHREMKARGVRQGDLVNTDYCFLPDERSETMDRSES